MLPHHDQEEMRGRYEAPTTTPPAQDNFRVAMSHPGHERMSVRGPKRNPLDQDDPPALPHHTLDMRGHV